MMRLVLRLIAPVVLVAAILGAYNFFTIGAASESAARTAACPGRARCTPVLTRIERTAFWQDAHFRLRGQDAPVAQVRVRCARAAYLVGELRCALR